MNTSLFERNVSALAARQPDLALVLRTMSLPTDACAAVGRDGSATFRVVDKTGRRIWLGRSSMPTVSAASLFGRCALQGGNAALPGMLTGLEPLVLAERLPSYAALFVLDADPLSIKLAMHLWDYCDSLTRGRIVFVPEGDIAVELKRFFDRNPGFELPLHLFTVPQVPPPQAADLQRRLEAAGEAVVELQSHAIAAAIHKLDASRPTNLPAAPRVSVVGVDPRPFALEQAYRIERALAALGWPARICVPDAPGQCHAVARVQAVAEHRADLVIFVNNGAERLRPLLPPQLPILTWHACESPIPVSAWRDAGPNDFCAVASADVLNRAIADGLPPTRLCHLPALADAVLFQPPTSAAAAAQDHLVILGDLPDDRAEANGIALTSHVALWSALQKSAEADVDRLSDPGIRESVFARAQQQSGISLKDASVRDAFSTWFQTTIAPAAFARAAVRAAAKLGLSIELHGRNWAPEAEATVASGTLPLGRRLLDVIQRARAVVLLDDSLMSRQIAIDVETAGVTALVRCTAAEAPSRELAQPSLASFHTVKELVGLLKSRLVRTPANSRPGAIGSPSCTVAQQLRFLVAKVREAATAAPTAPPHVVHF